MDGKPVSSNTQEALQKIFSILAVLPSLQAGLFDAAGLTVSGDGTAVASHSPPYGRHLSSCDHSCSFRSTCGRHYSDPDAGWGWDSDNETWFFDHTLYMLCCRNAKLKVELPLLMNFTDARRHDSKNFLYAIDSFGRNGCGLSPKNICLDSAHNNIPTYKLLEHWGINALIDINGRSKSSAGATDDITFNKEGHPLCRKYMGKFPVISITLKGATGTNYEEAKEMLRHIIGNEAMRFQFLMQSPYLTEIERTRYEALISIDKRGDYTMSDAMLKSSLQTLSQLLQKHYGQGVIMLIDEYDVPLDKAYQSGYYDAMVELIRVLFGNAFKTNDSLKFAVLTGCLRISKESIFTGLNNFRVYTVKDVRYDEYLGFTDMEIRQMLEYYGFSDQYDAVKEWYDGYLFGSLEIYCPWDVINYCADLRGGSVTEPQNYCVNTSSNDIIRRFLSRADAATRDEIELLINGGHVKKMIHQELTYRDLDSDIDNLWSILFTTGYLTRDGEDEEDISPLTIPNREIRWIYVQQIRKWFKDESRKDTRKLENLRRAFEENDTAAIEKEFSS